MNILILVQIFETHDDTGSDRHFYFAEYFSAAGHNTSVVTSNFDYKNSRKRFESKGSVLNRSIGRLSIKYVSVYDRIKGSFLKRSIFFASFFIRAIYVVWKEPRPDVVYAVSTPLTVGLLGVLASWIHRCPLVFEVTDVWPDAAIHTGVIKNQLIICLAKAVEQFCYRNASTIVCLTKGIQKLIISKGVDPLRTLFIPNGVDPALFRPVAKEDRDNIRLEYGLTNKFVLMYLGAHGLYNSLDTIILCADVLKKRDDIAFVLVGEGEKKMELMDMAHQLQLNNVVFIGTVPRSKSVKLLSASDVFLLPNLKGSFFKCNLPNKLFDFMASAKPVIVCGKCESSALVLHAGSGYVVSACDPFELSREVERISLLSASELSAMGCLGRQHVLSHYNRRNHAQSLLDCLILHFEHSQIA